MTERADHHTPLDPEQGVVAERSQLADERSNEAGGRKGVSAIRSSRWIVPAVAAAVLGAAGLGLVIRVTLDGGVGHSGLAQGFLRDLLAAMSWIPVGAGVVWLARRFPVRAERPLAPALIHLVGIGAAAFAVNVLIVTAWWIARLEPETPGLVALVLTGTVRHVHANALIYLFLLAIVMGTRTSRIPGSGAAVPGTRGASGHRLAVSHGARTLLLPLDRVDWIEAAGDYASVHSGDRSYLLSERMHAIEARLREKGFARAHRSAIVNLASVAEIRSEPAGNCTLILKNQTEVPLSRRRREEVEARLGVRGKMG